MYSHFLRVHQRLNKVAYRVLQTHIGDDSFPTARDINQFEGKEGPDGLKVKSSGEHEPEHFYDPEQEEGSALLSDLQNHYDQLVATLRRGDTIRSAFEASWLAHTLTDGLTPAHHPPFKDQIEGLKTNGRHVVNPRDKLLVRGDTATQTLAQTWQHVGLKGALLNHLHFEMGAGALILGAKYDRKLDQTVATMAKQVGVLDFFKHQARLVYTLDLYNRFLDKGWTIKLARDTKQKLAPIIIQTIAATWLLAYEEARRPK